MKFFRLEDRLKDRNEEPAYDKERIEALDSWIMNCRIHITSGYSDGWTIEHYKKELDKALTLKKSWGTQLEIPFA
tara:strand:+ start:370 stop:594 length:225 start_codon:yes stop_codon:yes gene_type:complete